MNFDAKSLAAAAHDVRTPLQMLSGALELIKLTAAAADDIERLERMHEGLESIGRLSGAICASLSSIGHEQWNASVRDTAATLDERVMEVEATIADFSRSASGHAITPRIREDLRIGLAHLDAALFVVRRAAAQPIDARAPTDSYLLHPLLQEIVVLFEGAVRERSLELLCTCPHELAVSADRRLLSTILSNLVGNAVKYTDAGRVEVSASDDQEGFALISVRDTGIGMDEATLRTLTQLGTRGLSPEVQRRQGDGIGLHSAASAAQQLGTSLSFRSVVGEGTAVSFAIPMAGPDSHSSQGSPQASS